MNKKSVLVVCIHNSARSQMAEAFINKYGIGRFAAESAGLEPGRLNPLVVEVMGEIGIDISGNRVKSVDEFLDKGTSFDYVITVCDETRAEECPYFPGNGQRIHWGFDDPSAFAGTHAEKLMETRMVRDKIEKCIIEWIKVN